MKKNIALTAFLLFMGSLFLLAQDQGNRFAPFYPIWKQGKMGLIDQNGKIKVEPVYAHVELINYPDYYFILEEGENFSISNEQGQILPTGPLKAAPKQRFPKWEGRPSQWILLSTNDGYKMLNGSSGEVLPTIYQNPSPSYFHIAQISNGKWHFFKEDGQIWETPPADSAEVQHPDFAILRVNGQTQLYFFQSKKLIPSPGDYRGDTLPNHLFNDGQNYFLLNHLGEKVGGPFTQISPYNQYLSTDLFQVQENGKIGVINGNGKVILPSYCDEFINQYPWVLAKKDGKWAVLDSSLKPVTPFVYESIVDKNLYLTTGKVGKETHLLHYKKGKVATLEPGIQIMDCNNQIATYKKGTQYGILTISGKRVTPPSYSRIQLLDDQSAQVLGSEGKKIIHIENGKLLTRKRLMIVAEEDDANNWTNNMRFQSGNTPLISMPRWPWDYPLLQGRGWFQDPETGKWGFADPASGDTTLKASIDWIMPVPGRTYTLIMKGKWDESLRIGIFNETTNRVEVPPTTFGFDWNNLAQNQISRFTTSQGRWFIYEVGKKPYALPKMAYVQFSETPYYSVLIGGRRLPNSNLLTEISPIVPGAVRETTMGGISDYIDGKWMMIQWRNPDQIHLQFDELTFYKNGIGIFRDGETWGLVDTLGTRLCQGYSNLVPSGNLFLGSHKLEHYAIIDTHGRIVSDLPLQSYGTWQDGLLPAKLGGKWGYLDEKGTWVISPQFEYAQSFYNGYAAIFKKDSTFYIDKQANILFGVHGQQHQFFHDNWVLIRARLGYKYLNPRGESLFPDWLKVATPFQDGIAIIKMPQGYTLIRQDGKPIIEGEYAEEVKMGSMGGYEWKTEKQTYWVTASGAKIKLPKDAKIVSCTAQICLFQTSKGKMMQKVQEKRPVNFHFEEVRPFVEGAAAVKRQGMWGYLNQQGEWLVEPQFMAVGDLEKGYAWVKTDKGIQIMGASGKILPMPPMAFLPKRIDETWLYNNDEKYQIWDLNGPVTPLRHSTTPIYLLPNRKWIELDGKSWVTKNDTYSPSCGYTTFTKVHVEGPLSILSLPKVSQIIDTEGKVLFTIWQNAPERFGNWIHYLVNGSSIYINENGELVYGMLANAPSKVENP